jgi:hypothetical protein
MSELAIFGFGVFVSLITTAGVVLLVGFSEAADPAHSRYSDLSSLERSVVDRSPEDSRRDDGPTDA